MNSLQQKYKENILPALITEFGYGSPMAAPRLEKVTLNMGVSDALGDRKVLDSAVTVSYTHLTLPTNREV